MANCNPVANANSQIFVLAAVNIVGLDVVSYTCATLHSSQLTLSSLFSSPFSVSVSTITHSKSRCTPTQSNLVTPCSIRITQTVQHRSLLVVNFRPTSLVQMNGTTLCEKKRITQESLFLTVHGFHYPHQAPSRALSMPPGPDLCSPLRSILTPWCRDLLENLTGLQLVKKFPAFHGTRRFITALTSVRHFSLSWASPIQSIYPHPTSWRSILILSTHLRLGLTSGLFPAGFPTKNLYTLLSSPIRATCPAHLILLDFITRKILGEEYNPIRCIQIKNLYGINIELEPSSLTESLPQSLFLWRNERAQTHLSYSSIKRASFVFTPFFSHYEFSKYELWRTDRWIPCMRNLRVSTRAYV